MSKKNKRQVFNKNREENIILINNLIKALNDCGINTTKEIYQPYWISEFVNKRPDTIIEIELDDIFDNEGEHYSFIFDYYTGRIIV